MREYTKVSLEGLELKKVYCNCCSLEIKRSRHGMLEDHITLKKRWGYYSNFDGEEHEMDICCDCYEKWISTFKLSVRE